METSSGNAPQKRNLFCCWSRAVERKWASDAGLSTADAKLLFQGAIYSFRRGIFIGGSRTTAGAAGRTTHSPFTIAATPD
jgi:hypothetical protein